MKLKIVPTDTLPVEKEFLDWLIQLLKVKIYKTTFDTKRIFAWDEYINTTVAGLSNRKLSTKRLIVSAFSNLVYIKYEKYYCIEIDLNVVVPYTNYKLVDMIKLINDGNLDMRGYPFITNAVREIERNLNNYYKIYKGAI